MTLTPHTRRSDRAGRGRAAARGLLAVLLCLLDAADALVTARLGLPRLAWLLRIWSQEIASEYRRGYHHARDIDVTADTTDQGDE